MSNTDARCKWTARQMSQAAEILKTSTEDHNRSRATAFRLIAQATGMSVSSVEHRYYRQGETFGAPTLPSAQQSPTKESRDWSQHELLRARAWRRAGYSYTQIDGWLNRHRGATQRKLAYEAVPAISRHRASSIHGPSPAVLAERDARYDASQRKTLTQAFCGDPPPGFSALDRRGA